MADNVANELGSILQSASIKCHPDIRFDSNPSTAASKKTPVHISTSPSAYEDLDLLPDEIPLSALDPPPRRTNLPPLPDLRFEQSYLARIKTATTWQAIAWITFLDHVLMPLSQGTIWNLALFGWRHWNTAAKFSGAGAGAKIRRWWWGVNNWAVPAVADARSKRVRADKVSEFYVAGFGNAAGD